MKKSLLYEDIYEQQFSFGTNWQKFLRRLTPERITRAEQSLVELFGPDGIRGRTFVDIGCGSGLFSLAAWRLGARRVISVDIDRNSLACVTELRKRESDPTNWEIQPGSALDKTFVGSLGPADIVYSWGVLHHTGDMWRAIEQVMDLVAPGGRFCIALYNQVSGLKNLLIFFPSPIWLIIKRVYNRGEAIGQWLIEKLYITYLLVGVTLFGKNPVTYVRDYDPLRGMDFLTDVRDWLGGHPYEYASPVQVRDFFKQRGFDELFSRTTPSIGCNEFVFQKIATDKND